MSCRQARRHARVVARIAVAASLGVFAARAARAQTPKPAGDAVASTIAAFEKSFKGSASRRASAADRKAAVATLAGCDEPRVAESIVRATLWCEDEVAVLVRDEIDVLEKTTKVFAAATKKPKGESEKPPHEKPFDRHEFERRQAASFESNAECEREVRDALVRCEDAFKVLTVVPPPSPNKPHKDEPTKPLTEGEKKTLEQQLARAGELRRELDARRATEEELRRALELLRGDDSLAWLAANGPTNVRLPPSTRLVFATNVGNGATGGPTFAKALLEGLPKAKESRELVAIAQSLARLGVAGAIAPLIERCDAEKGATRKRLSLALEMLTRQSLGVDAKPWQEWFARDGQKCLSGELPLGPGDAWPSVQLFGAPLEGRRFVFALDCSGEMTTAVDAATTRLDAARNALFDTLAKLAPTSSFDVVIYAHEARAFSKKLVEATPENVKRAQEWLGKVTTTPETIACTRRALAEAFQLGAGEGGATARGLDTIVLVSASHALTPEGRPDATDELLATIKSVNESGTVLLHTVAFGPKADVPFLKTLAEQNGGSFFRR